jgi:hypothetical protein
MKQRTVEWMAAVVVASAVSAGSPTIKTQWVPEEIIPAPGRNETPQFSPDATQIAFQSTRSDAYGIWVRSRDGVRRLWRFDGPLVGSPRWSPNGALIAFDCRSGERGAQISVGSSEGGWWMRRTFDASDHVRPSWSHDGRWIYFGSNRGGQWQIWKVPANVGPAEQVTHGGGREAFADQHFIYYTKDKVPGIWKIPVGGRAETQVAGEGEQGRWALTARGIYYLRRNSVMWIGEAGRGEVLPLRLPPETIRGMTVSDDGNEILIVHGDDANSGITLYSRKK